MGDLFCLGLDEVPEGFGSDHFDQGSVPQDFHFDLGEIRNREGQLHGAVFKKLYFLVPVPDLLPDPTRLDRGRR
jgi:hypothetical protein